MATLEERKEQLFNDPDLSVVEPHRVFCKRCDKWLKLDEVKLYAASVWRCHKNTKSHNARPPASDGPSPAPASSLELVAKNARRGARGSTKSLPLPPARQSRRSGASTPAASPSAPAPNSQTRLTIKIPSSLQKESSAESPWTSVINGPGQNFSQPSTDPVNGPKRLREASPGASVSDDSSNQIELALKPTSSPNQSKESGGNHTSDATFPYPENIPPHRKASYKALVTEPFVGTLEPFRAYCTLCGRWVPLSSRTPYSHGVWKGHVKNSEKHKATLITGPDANPDSEVEDIDARLRHARLQMELFPEFDPFNPWFRPARRSESDGLKPHGGDNSVGNKSTGNDETDPMEVDKAVSNGNPFALKASTETGFAPQANTNQPKYTSMQVEGPVPNLTDSSNDEPFAKQTPQKKASLLALQRRRQTILVDPDAAVVEPRKVKCGICERWIKGSNTQEYSLHHWHKHKKKCLRNKKALLADKSELIEARKALLEADPDLTALEPHRALCNICNKWVKLCGRSRYSASHWFQHKKLCFTAQSGVQAVSSPQSAVTTAHERRMALEADLDAMTVWPGRIQCRHCHQLVTIPSFPPFMPAPWITHKGDCFKANDVIRKKLEKAPELRQETLTADCLITSLTPYSFDCKVCHTSVELDKSLPYSLNQWDAHKRVCGIPNKRLKKDDATPNGDKPQTDVNEKIEIPIGQNSDAKMDTIIEANSVLNTSNALPNESKEENVKMADEDPVILPFQNEDTLEGILGTQKPEDLIYANSRLNYFLGQHDVFRIEPHRALCGNCLTWITLGSDAFSVQKWKSHKGVCRGPKSYKASEESQGTDVYGINSLKQALANRPSLKPVGSVPKKRLKSVESKRPQSPVALPPLPPRPRWSTEDERKQLFLDDEDVSRIEPHRLLCKLCNCWIRLHPVVRYSQSVWPKHKVACKEATQSSMGDARVRAKSEKEDKRRQMLEDDPYVTDITPHRVTCNACGTNIRLDTTYKYEGSHWRAHRARCPHIPFHERSAKKRKHEGRRASQTLDNARLQDSPTGESSDSYDSDASSAPRPQPTSFFTAPLEINPTKMFSSRTRHGQPRNHISKDPGTKTEKTDTLLYLQKVAQDLTESGRLTEIINLANGRKAPISKETDSSEEQIPSPDTVYSTFRSEHSESEPKPPASPYLDIPRIKDLGTADAFDALFKSLNYDPWPSPNNVRACTLEEDSLPVVD